MNDPKNGSAPKKTSRKLKLNRTTVRQLSEEHLADVAGGNETVTGCPLATIVCDTNVTCSIGPSNGQRCTLSIPKHIC